MLRKQYFTSLNVKNGIFTSTIKYQERLYILAELGAGFWFWFPLAKIGGAWPRTLSHKKHTSSKNPKLMSLCISFIIAYCKKIQRITGHVWELSESKCAASLIFMHIQVRKVTRKLVIYAGSAFFFYLFFFNFNSQINSNREPRQYKWPSLPAHRFSVTI